MVELIYTLLLAALFFLMSRKEKHFQANKQKYIDESKVFLSGGDQK